MSTRRDDVQQMSGEQQQILNGSMSVARLICGYGVIAAVLPYLVLKVLWVSGNMVGVPESSPAHDGWEVQNAVTLGMDIVAIFVALTFTHRWGLRLPAWLVVVPSWMGIGFLVPAAVEVPVGFTYSLLTTGQLVSMKGGLVEPWTYTVVYMSFAVQGVLLSASFVGYVRERWADLFGRTDRELKPGVTHGVQMVLATAGAIMAVAIAGLHLFQAFWAPNSWHDGEWTFTVRLVEGVEGGMAVLAAVGILAMTRSPIARLLIRRSSFWITLAITWTGAGSMFSYGLFRTFSTLAGAQLSELITPVDRILNLAALLAGLIIGVTGAFLLAERRSTLRGRIDF
jgi:hypothetical protein